MTAPRALPNAATLKLPENIQDINASEIGRFSPMRSRDITGSVMATHDAYEPKKIDITLDTDPHIGPYDCCGAVSLSSSMQSNVPSPFGGGRQGFLGMPGSQWGHGQKYLSDHLHSSHYLNLRNTYGRGIHGTAKNSGITNSYHTRAAILMPAKSCFFSRSQNSCVESLYVNAVRSMSDGTKDTNEIGKPLSRKDKLKQAIAAYGSTVIVFHVTISLASLGVSYLLVSRYIIVLTFNYLCVVSVKALNWLCFSFTFMISF